MIILARAAPQRIKPASGVLKADARMPVCSRHYGSFFGFCTAGGRMSLRGCLNHGPAALSEPARRVSRDFAAIGADVPERSLARYRDCGRPRGVTGAFPRRASAAENARIPCS